MNNAVFIVGGGPSLKGFNFSKLADKETIVVNSAVMDVPNPTYFITCCTGYCKKVVGNNFYNTYARKVMVIGENHFNYKNVKNLLYAFDEVINPKTADGELGFTYDDFAIGGNSGFCALQYAVLLGYKNIYLLGIDVQTNNGDHYHTRYGLIQKEVDWWYKCFIRGLIIIKEKSDIKVYSCSPISKLNKTIPFVNFKDVVI